MTPIGERRTFLREVRLLSPGKWTGSTQPQKTTRGDKMDKIKIYGLQKLTLLDYPGRLACTVFLGGCNFRCPYCHNGSLVLTDGTPRLMGADELLEFLKSRVGRLQGVCISGGEPTLYPRLPELVAEIRSLGFEIKLDTNGTNPEMLRRLIDGGLVDYVAMDIKNSPEKYPLTAGLTPCGEGSTGEIGNSQAMIQRVMESAAILMEGRVDFEFRTTLMREHHTAEDIDMIGRLLAGGEKYFLQTYRDEGDLLVGGFTPFTVDETRDLLERLRKYIPNAEIR